MRAEADTGEEAEEEGGDHQEGKHRVEGFAGALPDAAEVQDVQREGDHEQVVPPGEHTQLTISQHQDPA